MIVLDDSNRVGRSVGLHVCSIVQTMRNTFSMTGEVLSLVVYGEEEEMECRRICRSQTLK